MSHPCFVIIPLFIILQFSVIEFVNGGFSVNLIHKIPASASSLVSKDIPQSPTNAYLGHYLMELNIGTPPVKIYGIADTGSDLTWTSCVPCEGCYKQLNPLFDPTKSSTYSNISCQSDQCLHWLDTGKCSSNNQCDYTYAYASASVTQGILAQDTITFISATGKPVPLQGVAFGCGHNDTGSFNDHEMGIIGLGGGPISLISQIGPSIGGKRFSQCLVPFHTDVSITSKMSFGDGSEVTGDGVVSTPMVIKEDKTPYFVTLNGLSVGSTYLPYDSSSKSVSKGNMFLDSGTPPTILPTKLYEELVDQVKKMIALTPIVDDPELGNQLCYRTSTNVDGPTITAHFEGADVQLNPIQTFISPKDGVLCFGFTNTSSDGGIYGNFAQSNYFIGFDLDRHTVSFKPQDCTKQQ
ncbi:putative nepenthesin [Lupinus albus]|uniref:Putative nepenthesin n=1 Tax=Lupinus albus TaxID=3870 RepID=A0A6A4P7J5_LUPAL|nr:putative nepenthesin [Lupinus albus]